MPPSIGTESIPVPNATTLPSSKPSTSSFSFPDLDYSDYIPDASPSISGTVKSALDKALWKYTNVLMAQPFEVAKLLLQVRVAQDEDGENAVPHATSTRHQQIYEEPDSDDDEPNFFTSTRQFTESPPDTPQRGRPGRPKPEKRASQLPQSTPESIYLKNPHSLLDALSALSSSDGPLAIWRATNSTFIYNILKSTLETFIRSLIAAALGVADTDILLTTSSSLPDVSILNSATPSAVVLIATLSSAAAALLLSPIDTARTRLILTPSTIGPRSLLGALNTLSPSWLIQPHLIPITFLSSTIPTLIASSTPLVLKSQLHLDPAMNPTSWSLFTFLGSAIDLAVKFPLETVLRRAQIATWTSIPTSRTSRKTKLPSPEPIQTIVPVPQSYPGILPTIWGIMRDEGYSESQKDKTAALMGKAPRRRRKGQGVEGLYRGWRVGLWGLVGIWSTSFIGGLQTEAAGEAGASVGAGFHGGKF